MHGMSNTKLAKFKLPISAIPLSLVCQHYGCSSML